MDFMSSLLSHFSSGGILYFTPNSQVHVYRALKEAFEVSWPKEQEKGISEAENNVHKCPGTRKHPCPWAAEPFRRLERQVELGL